MKYLLEFILEILEAISRMGFSPDRRVLPLKPLEKGDFCMFQKPSGIFQTESKFFINNYT